MEKTLVKEMREKLIGPLGDSGRYHLQIVCDNSVLFKTNPDDILDWDDNAGVLRAFRVADDNMYNSNTRFEVSVCSYDQIQYIEFFCNEHTFVRAAKDLNISDTNIKKVEALVHKSKFVKQNGFQSINDNNPMPDESTDANN